MLEEIHHYMQQSMQEMERSTKLSFAFCIKIQTPFWTILVINQTDLCGMK